MHDQAVFPADLLEQVEAVGVGLGFDAEAPKKAFVGDRFSVEVVEVPLVPGEDVDWIGIHASRARSGRRDSFAA